MRQARIAALKVRHRQPKQQSTRKKRYQCRISRPPQTRFVNRSFLLSIVASLLFSFLFLEVSLGRIFTLVIIREMKISSAVSSMVSKNWQRTIEERDDVMFDCSLDKNWQRTIEEKDDVMFDYNIDKSCFLFIESRATISIADLPIVLEVLEERQAKEKRPNRRIQTVGWVLAGPIPELQQGSLWRQRYSDSDCKA